MILTISGSILSGIGIELIVLANHGVDSLSTLILGIMKHSNWEFGTWSQILSIIYLIISLSVNSKTLGIGSLLNALLIGQTVKWIDPVFRKSISLNSYFTMAFGFLIMAFGTSMYLKGNLGSGPMEAMMYAVSQVLRMDMAMSRIILDAFNVLLGIFLGATFGIGSVLAIFGLGPMIKIFNGLWNKKNLFCKD
nr:membrane protein [Liquorilactobacillus satsumensis]